MTYLFLTYLDEKAWLALSETERQQAMAGVDPYVKQLIAEGKFLGGAPLQPASTANTVRGRSGKPLVTDGPFAETREHVGGYTLIEAKDLDEAVSIAAGFLGDSSLATIEVRAVAPMEGIPTH
ncbi:MAG TPA: YciI family protein [Bryobacteraceae bacterium]|jgi:hypothetical protein|nr:YciI family protein [Bryobacteraceae bacterium]